MSQHGCPFTPACPGCSKWQQSLAEEHSDKVQRLAQFIGAHPKQIEVLSVGEYGLRDFFDVQYHNGQWGFRTQAFPSTIATIASCPLLSPQLQDWYQQLRATPPPFQRASLRLRVDRRGNKGVWIDLAHQEAERLLHESKDYCTWLSQQARVEVGQQRKQLIEKSPGVWGLAKQGAVGPWFSSRFRGAEVDLNIRIGDFSQVSRQLNQKMLTILEGMVPPGARVLEVGAGSGNLSLPLLGWAHQLWALESMKTARENWLQNTEQCPTECRVGLVREADLDQLRADTIVLNPPRSGLGYLFKKINWSASQSLILLTCAPEQIAFSEIRAMGFQLQSATLVDQFPRTSHIEALLQFKR